MRACVKFSCISETFSQLSVRLWYLPSTLVNSPCIRGSFRQLPSTFCASMGPPETFRAAAGPSVNFSQLSVQPWELLSTFRASERPSVNFLCICGIFHQLSVWPRDLSSTFCVLPWDLPSTSVNLGPSVNFLCGCGTFRQHSLWPEDHPSAFLVSAGLSINFREFSVRQWDFTSILHASIGLSVSFRQLSMHPGNLRQLSLRMRDLQ